MKMLFQDVKKNVQGIKLLNIHDLMHDTTKQVAGKQIFMVNSCTNILDEKNCHLSDDAVGRLTQIFMARAKILSYI